jgi:hypothetical protein
MSEHKSPFTPVAEQKVADDFQKNEALLKQRYILAINVAEMGQQLSKKGWARVWAGVTAGITGKKVIFQDKVEEETSSQVRKLIGLEAMLIIADDRLLKATVAELDKMRKIYKERMESAEAAETKEGLE